MVKLVFFITFAVICVYSTIAQKENVLECLQESGLAEDLYKFADKDSMERMCFVKCMITKNGGIDDTGKINVDKINASFEKIKLPDTIKDSLKKCVTGIEKIEKCEDSKNLIDCWSNAFTSG